ncbi:hypothetical protein [Cupriavidus basilensis]
MKILRAVLLLPTLFSMALAYAQSPETAGKPSAVSPILASRGHLDASDAKDLGAMTGQSWLSGVKFRAWIDGYYVVNDNRPARDTVNANQSASVVKGQNVSVEGRTFDVQRSRPTLSLAEIEIEKIPEFGGFGFKLDLASGETQEHHQRYHSRGDRADALQRDQRSKPGTSSMPR